MYHHLKDVTERKAHLRRLGNPRKWVTSICAKCGDMTYQDKHGTRCFRCGATVPITVRCQDEAAVRDLIRDANAGHDYQEYQAEAICIHYRLLGDVIFAERGGAW